jgi:hypothetical protein
MIRLILMFAAALAAQSAFSLKTNGVWIPANEVLISGGFARGDSDSCLFMKQENAVRAGLGIIVASDRKIYVNARQPSKLMGVKDFTQQVRVNQIRAIKRFNAHRNRRPPAAPARGWAFPSDNKGAISMLNNGEIVKGYIPRFSRIGLDGKVAFFEQGREGEGKGKFYFPVTQVGDKYKVKGYISDFEKYDVNLQTGHPLGGGSFEATFSAGEGGLLSVGFDTERQVTFSGEQYYKRPYSMIMLESYAVKKELWKDVVREKELLGQPDPNAMPGSSIVINEKYYDTALAEGVYQSDRGELFLMAKILGVEDFNVFDVLISETAIAKEMYQGTWKKDYHGSKFCYRSGGVWGTKKVFSDEYSDIREKYGMKVEVKEKPKSGIVIRRSGS